jgi:hypothetical protein
LSVSYLVAILSWPSTVAGFAMASVMQRRAIQSAWARLLMYNLVGLRVILMFAYRYQSGSTCSWNT